MQLQMAMRNNSGNLYDPRKGDPAIRTQSFRLDGKTNDPPRTNYFVVISPSHRPVLNSTASYSRMFVTMTRILFVCMVCLLFCT